MRSNNRKVTSKTAREGRAFETAFNILISNSQVVNVDEEVSKIAGVLHSEMRKAKKDFGVPTPMLWLLQSGLGCRF